ncbi:HTH-type transcriptional regulator ImmR [compost metagenome]
MAAALKGARKAAGLSQVETASRLGIEQSIISRIETAERDVTVPELMTFADLYGVSASELLGAAKPCLPTSPQADG